MDEKYIKISLIAVIIIVAAAGAAYFLFADNGDDSDVPTNTDGRLMIYGNANNDDYLDDRDLDFIQAVSLSTMAWMKSRSRSSR